MENFKPQLEWNMPLSGGVTMPITMPGAIGGQFGLFNINLGGSGNAGLEREMLDHVGSYGRQIGWLCDAVEAILASLAKAGTPVDPADKAIKTFRKMADEIRFRKHIHKPSPAKAVG